MALEGHSDDCFVCALGADVRLEDDGRVVAELVLGDNVTGPEPYTHGGAIAALFDELLGVAAEGQGQPVMTAHLEIDFRRPWPVGAPARMTCEARRLGERKVLATGELLDGDGELLAEARGLWVVPRGG